VGSKVSGFGVWVSTFWFLVWGLKFRDSGFWSRGRVSGFEFWISSSNIWVSYLGFADKGLTCLCKARLGFHASVLNSDSRRQRGLEPPACVLKERLQSPTGCAFEPCNPRFPPATTPSSSSLFITLGLGLSDTKIYESYIRALLGTPPERWKRLVHLKEMVQHAHF